MMKFMFASLLVLGAIAQAHAVPVPATAQHAHVYNCPQPVGHDAGCVVHQKAVRK